MQIPKEITENGCTFKFNIGVLNEVEIINDNRLLINGYEMTEWVQPNQQYTKPQNQESPKMHMKNDFYSGDAQMPILTASRCADGRIFLRLYKHEAAYKKMRQHAEWIGSYWKGEVYEKN